MIETEDLILDKAKFEDWEGLYRNVWSRPECARYMFWRLSTDEKDAQERILRTIQFERDNDAYLVYDKRTGTPIGFAGVEELSPGVYQETGIALGPDYVHRGLGTQLLGALIRYCREEHGAREFIYSTRDENEASNRLAMSMGFERFGSQPATDPKDGHSYQQISYRLELS